jgi:putative Holliday junction resolvase
MIVAAIDFGRRRIGVAATDELGLAAHPVGIVERISLRKDIEAIRKMLSSRTVGQIIVGLPLNMDGTEGDSARSARTFAEALGTALGISVGLFDERLSTFEARSRLKSKRSGNRGSPRVDAIAAAIILEGWMAAQL